ncbi:MAG: D-tyrosyl-tRNA(Tyr) deacylase [Gammaproteobacteria bacterium]|nr:D-tyrosyl-tRNA(Tyr) deacylase [Gammaproteobacteria bacterium]
MRALLQRVSSARVEVTGEVVGSIERGLLVLLGVAVDDNLDDADRLARRTLDLRIFPDDAKPMNRSLMDVAGELLVVSQFTLCADTRRGRRPGFSTAAPPERAEALYERYVKICREAGVTTATGRFGADMQVHLVNDGPVTFLLE